MWNCYRITDKMEEAEAEEEEEDDDEEVGDRIAALCSVANANEHLPAISTQ